MSRNAGSMFWGGTRLLSRWLMLRKRNRWKSNTPLVGHKSTALLILGLAAFTLYLWFFVGFNGLFSFLSKLNLYQYSLFYTLAAVAFFLAVVFDSLIWHSLLSSLSIKIKLRKIMLYNWIGNFVELVIPTATVGGELTRIVPGSKRNKKWPWNSGWRSSWFTHNQHVCLFRRVAGQFHGASVLPSIATVSAYTHHFGIDC